MRDFSSSRKTIADSLLDGSDKVIPRQLFEVPIQAVIGKKVIARETLSAYRADVTAGLYGGDSRSPIPLPFIRAG